MPASKPGTGYVWNGASTRWRDTATGRYISQTRMTGMRDTYLDSKKAQSDALMGRLFQGDITSNQWTLEMRQVVKETYINEYLAAHGGVQNMTQADWGRLGNMLRGQYAYLDKFQADLNAGKLAPGQAKVRARMYIESASQSFEKGKADARGLPTLPAYPGDGQTVCRCITSGESRIQTARGLVAMLDVRIGDLVLTHLGRWQSVTGLIAKPSEQSHEQYWLRAPSGALVGCTNTHRWLTSRGWIASSDIGNSDVVCYNANHENTQDLPEMRSASEQPVQAEHLQKVPVSMCLRELERLSGGRMPIVRHVSQGKTAMARTAGNNSAGPSAWRYSAAAHLCRFVRRYELAVQSGWSRLCVLLDGRGEAPFHLPLSMALATGVWGNPGRFCDSPQGRESNTRRAEQSGITGESCAPTFAWETGARASEGTLDEENMRDLRQVVFGKGAPGQTAEVLFGGVLPRGTTLYDIEVAEDHSYIIEGLVSHNSNCRCHWQIVDTETGWDCTWTLGEAEHCPDCVKNAAHWNPLEVTRIA